MVSNGFLPAWLEAKETWPGVCQSCVSTTCRNRRPSALIGSITALPSLTASDPPGRKSFCTSTTISTSVSLGVIGAVVEADARPATAVAARPPAMPSASRRDSSVPSSNPPGRARASLAEAKASTDTAGHHSAIAAWHTSTHRAPVNAASRAGAMRSEALIAPAAGTTSSKSCSETSQ